ncbi:unnamed protein product [Bursaphelenchus xylophilus]|uniref:(pine wood nematode) hypothetical protein n=1 Tax=Bursaphelenchus xylophilus TaxID=6326 RepID=A0A1I7S4Q3_BURXY|nr:unnamed protein product [Bursaphelenchus xylophilus]CAG9117293.1 unnamed protein product [Bursaphelenchus xylophilus]
MKALELGGLAKVLVVLLTVNVVLYFVYQYCTRNLVNTVPLRQPFYEPPTLLNEKCKIPQLDPFDPSIRQYLNPFLRNEKCNVTFTPKSELKWGKLTVAINDADCQYRCAEHVNDREVTFTDWQDINRDDPPYPKCDVVEVRCDRNGRVVYEHVHAQVYEKHVPAEGEPRYNVHILLLDSVSHSQYIRSMQLTRTFLNWEFQAIEFPYLSKVSLNSRPNAYAFLLNEPVEMYKNKFGVYSAPAFKSKLCDEWIDKYNYIGKHFNEAGYVTMVNEDWQFGAFSWPNCKGFQRPYANHSNKAYVQLTNGSNRFSKPNVSENLYANSCKESHHHIFENIKEFVGKYEGIPKFSFTWMTTLAHENGSALYRTDEDFLKFFKTMADDLQDSFFFITSDHGNRIDPIRQTAVGLLEEMNPMLTMVLPKNIRRHGNIRKILKENSKRLLTFYDLYATWLEISQLPFFAYDGDLEGSEFKFPKQKILGKSLFHPIPERHSCFELGVPLEFCLCQYDTEVFTDNNTIKKAARLIVAKINDDMWKNGLREKCEELSFDEDIPYSAIAYTTPATFGAKIFKVKFSVSPGKGQYEGTMALEEDGNVQLITQEFPRVDSYESHAQCVPFSLYRQYCHCK